MNADRFAARLLLGLLTGLFCSRAGHAQTLAAERLWVTDGNVRTVERVGGSLYLGGDFAYVGPVTGAAVAIDATAGTPRTTVARLQGIVRDAVSDRAGGWFIGRDLRTDGIEGPSLVHVLADGTLDPVALPQPDGPIYALALGGATLYFAGDFATVDGQSRRRAAAIDLASGTVIGWNPDVTGMTTLDTPGVFDLQVHEDRVVLAGNFDHVSGQLRRNLAAVARVSAQVLAWNPSPDFPVYAIARAGETIYLGGVFGRVGGVVRASLAAVDRASGAVLPWNPSAFGYVEALAVTGATVYAGGTFNSVGGQLRFGAAAIDATSGAILPWNPGLDVNRVAAIATRDGVVYLGGDFHSANGRSRLRLAAVDGTKGQPLPWVAHTAGTVHALALDQTDLLVGGAFNSVGGVARNFAAALDLRTGRATAWNPNANGSVTDMVSFGETLFIVGGFNRIGAARRNYAAELDRDRGVATSWNPPDIDIPPHQAVAVTSTHVYVAGGWSKIDSRLSGGLAELDRTTGALTPRDFGFGNFIGFSVNALALDGQSGLLYAGGFFDRLAGAPRDSLAALDLDAGTPTAWNPGARGTVRALAQAGDRLYVAGDFDRLAGTARLNAGAVSKAAAAALSWRPELSGGDGSIGSVLTLEAAANAVYAGGSFTHVGGAFHINIAALDPDTGALLAWDPVPRGTGTFTFSGYVYDVERFDGRVILGGNYSTLLEEMRSGVGVVTTPAP